MLVFDIEADGFLDDCTKVHSLVIKDKSTGFILSCADGQPQYRSIEDGLSLLSNADGIVGHNILGYDIDVLQKIYPTWNPPKYCLDTLVISRLIYTNLLEEDLSSNAVPTTSRGSHSLEAWGYRLQLHKGDYRGGWEKWSKDMQDYCELDVEVTDKLFDLFLSKKYSEQAIKLEHDFAKLMIQQERNGVPFNKEEAEELYSELFKEREQLRKTIAATVPPKKTEEIFIPKRDNKTLGYVKGIPFTKKKVEPFNANSRKQVYEFLHNKYGWTPDKKTDNGNPSLDAEVMEEIEPVFPEAKLFKKYFELSLLMPKIKTGKQAWLKCIGKDGRIHGRVNTNGAVTGRCTHSRPNLAQVPSSRKFKGKECRSLFHAPPGMVMVGCDASGLELRCLAHFLAPYDNGNYIKILLEGDVHTANMEAAGIQDRDIAKRFIYAFLYGAGYAKLGAIIDPGASKEKRTRIGKQLKTSFLAKTPGLGSLIQDVQRAAKRGYLVGLDGRHLHIRSLHKALNTLLQSAGGLVMKKAAVYHNDRFSECNYSVLQALNVHDENQVFCYPEDAEPVGAIMSQAIVSAGEYFNFRCPLDATYHVGENWYETH